MTSLNQKEEEEVFRVTVVRDSIERCLHSLAIDELIVWALQSISLSFV